jgi:hypothetical protein
MFKIFCPQSQQNSQLHLRDESVSDDLEGIARFAPITQPASSVLV